MKKGPQVSQIPQYEQWAKNPSETLWVVDLVYIIIQLLDAQLIAPTLQAVVHCSNLGLPEKPGTPKLYGKTQESISRWYSPFSTHLSIISLQDKSPGHVETRKVVDAEMHLQAVASFLQKHTAARSQKPSDPWNVANSTWMKS